jgi:hypothetical protein
VVRQNGPHPAAAASLAPIPYIAFARLDVVPDPAERVGSKTELVGMALITMCLGVTAASGYEIYEWIVDRSVRTCTSARPTRSPTWPTAYWGLPSVEPPSSLGRSRATRPAAFRGDSNEISSPRRHVLHRALRPDETSPSDDGCAEA